MELEWDDTDKGKLKYSEKSMFQGHFFHHKFPVDLFYPGVLISP
jgi:hypothetical protein